MLFQKILDKMKTDINRIQGRKMHWLGMRKGNKNGGTAVWYLDTQTKKPSPMSTKVLVKEPMLWGLGEPGPLGDCAAIDSGLKWKWNSVSCSIHAYVICERSGAQRFV